MRGYYEIEQPIKPAGKQCAFLNWKDGVTNLCRVHETSDGVHEGKIVDVKESDKEFIQKVGAGLVTYNGVRTMLYGPVLSTVGQIGGI